MANRTLTQRVRGLEKDTDFLKKERDYAVRRLSCLENGYHRFQVMPDGFECIGGPANLLGLRLQITKTCRTCERQTTRSFPNTRRGRRHAKAFYEGKD